LLWPIVGGVLRVEVYINGAPREIAEGATIAGLLEELEITVRHVAVEVNMQLVPRAKHSESCLQAGDRLEVVTLVGGG
jgi:sulfur carrier protein